MVIPPRRCSGNGQLLFSTQRLLQVTSSELKSLPLKIRDRFNYVTLLWHNFIGFLLFCCLTVMIDLITDWITRLNKTRRILYILPDKSFQWSEVSCCWVWTGLHRDVPSLHLYLSKWRGCRHLEQIRCGKCTTFTLQLFTRGDERLYYSNLL